MVAERIQSGKYKEIAELEADLQLIFSNARSFNERSCAAPINPPLHRLCSGVRPPGGGTGGRGGAAGVLPWTARSAPGRFSFFIVITLSNIRYILLMQQDADSVPVTTRQLESLIRLTEARAKMELREQCTRSDAQDVVEIMKVIKLTDTR